MSQPYQPQQPPQQPPWGQQPITPPPPPPKQKRFGLLALAITGVAGLVLGSCTAGLVAGGSADVGAVPAATATATVTETVPADPVEDPADEPAEDEPTEEPEPEPKKDSNEITDGQYLINKEIKPGTWKSGKAEELCYADTQNKAGDILEQEVGSEGETTIIRIKKTAYTFTSRGCGTWKKVD